MFTSMNVMTEKELKARNEVKWEMYSKKIAIESRVLGNMALNHIIPIALRYQDMLLDNVVKLSQVLPKKAAALSKEQVEQIEAISSYIAEVKKNVSIMVAEREKAEKMDSEEAKANAYHDKVEPLFEKIRTPIDQLEFVVDNELWPLPKYRELLFIR